MKIAILILAHKNIIQLLRLAQRLQGKDIDLYIHLDKKWNVSTENILALKRYAEIIDERISCGLDSDSLVDAELKLLKCASKKQYHYYCLISGQDYPICSNEEIVNKLIKNYPKSIIDVTPYAKGNWVWLKFNASSWYKDKNTILNKKINNRIIKKVIKSFCLIWDIVVIQRGNTLYKKLQNMNTMPYGGSEWWILSDLAVQEIFTLIEHEKEICTLIKQGFTPEEIFFQTLFMKTKFASEITVNDPMENERRCATYIDFGGGGRIKSAHPYVLTMGDAKKIIQAKEKGYMFARKFDLNEDEKIFDFLDKYMGEINDK